MSDDPGRWLDQADLDPDVRRALTAGTQEAPSDAQLSSLAARLGPLLGPGGGPSGGGSDGGGAAGGASGTAATGGGMSLAAKAMGGLMAAVAVTGVGLFMAVPDQPHSPVHDTAPADVTAPAPETSTDAPDAIPEGLDAPAPAVDPAPRPAPRPALETDPAAELALIRQAQSALRASPSDALSHTAAHQRRFGDGTLAQEREVVAIDALVRLERTAQARARATRFRARWPRSAHVRRIDVLVPPE